MLLRKEYTDNGGLLGIWRMDESCEELLQLLPEYSRCNAVEHIKMIRSERRTIEWLATRILLFTLLGEEKIILNHSDGKPYLQDDTLQISISHTKDYAAIYLHKSHMIGIDIEIRSERVNKVAHKFIGENEYIDPSQRTVHQLLHWSAKESMFKLMEENEIHFKHHLHILPFTPQLKGIFKATETKTDFNSSYDINYEVDPNYVLTWITGGKLK